MKIAFKTLGCKVNQYDTEAISEQMRSAGYKIADSTKNADIVVINSCTVTAGSDSKLRQLIAKTKRENPNAIIALTGCFPQAYPEKASKLYGVDIVTGTANRGAISEQIESFLKTRQRVIDICEHGSKFEKTFVSNMSEHSRAFVKIEEGCENYCSYCIIPTARGKIRSKPLADIEKELQNLAAAGYKEVVLVGINLTAYGKDLGTSLLHAVDTACSIEDIERVRLGSLEPDSITPAWVEGMSRYHKLCPHFHLSLQSGCDATLARMNRHYTTSQYFEAVNLLRQSFDNCAITTDIMVGFPGETQQEFDVTLNFVKKVGFARAHVFIYSRREGTKAAKMPNQVPKSIAAQRSRLLIQETKRSKAEFLSSQIGKTLNVLVETTTRDGYNTGYSENYTMVKFKSENVKASSILPVKITSTDGECCFGVFE